MQLEGKCVAFGREANDGSILVEGGKSVAVCGRAAFNGRGQVFKVHVLHSAERQMMVASWERRAVDQRWRRSSIGVSDGSGQDQVDWVFPLGWSADRQETIELTECSGWAGSRSGRRSGGKLMVVEQRLTRVVAVKFK
jgi:hypothetical protein